ncbi:pseudouridine-5'-phosphate glycosidase [Sanyastnella coralliicola]|uniref:pseudouridine-5'-phosphate glycosidase n=1 Tax=Sanyastnella coralliicola TaxID=3069118 RepID=UPI0027BAFDED|nr:pseudouridine-5'-phosphate glycosidase [Longitalea sp. SCSIO 12813]
MSTKLEINEEVAQALSEGRPVVALESTIIAHGMPFPQNVDTARRVEQAIRDNGAIPATIAVLDGKIKVGLTNDDVLKLTRSAGVMKLSRRDLAWAVSKEKHGATTVAATMIIAEMAGINVFVTGGIGGVHRGAELSWDVSADLTELGQTNVAVVSAGAKAILDIPATLEYLETLGVPVVGFKTGDFPAFYSRQSGSQVEYRCESYSELAKFITTKWDLDLKGGVLVANPIPEEHSMDHAVIEEAIQLAIAEAEKQGVKGKALTPFLLSRVKQHTSGKSLESNVALVLHNAEVGAQLAREIALLKSV